MTYQPLTPEQFNAAKQAGFKPEQIIEMEKKRKAEMEPAEKKPGLLKSLAKSIVSPAATIAARPVQLGAQLLGASSQEVDAATKKLAGDWIAPTPKSGKDVVRDVGRGLETAALGVGGGAVGAGLKGLIKQGAVQGSKAGALSGAGMTLGTENSTAGGVFGGALGGAALGGVFGAAIPGAIGAAKAIPGAVKAVPEIGKAVGSAVGTTPARVASRAQEKVQNVVEKQRAMSKSAPHVREAMKQGIEDTHIQFLQAGSKTDKAVRAEMLDIAKKASKDLTSFDKAVSKPGEQLLNGPVKHLIDVKNKGVEQTKTVLDSLVDKPQNARNMYDQFLGDMKDMGVEMIDGRLVTTRGSRVPEGDLKFYNEVLRDLMPDTKGAVPLTYKQMHAIRQKFFDVAEADSTFTSGPVNYARALRARLGEEIDKAAGGKYIKAQTQTRESLDSLRELVKFLGYKGKLEDITAKDLKAGESFFRLLGNASDRPNAVLDDIYKVAQKYKYKGDENIKTQLRFADMLSDLYGEPSRSLSGQIARAGSVGKDPAQVAAQSLREMVKWSPYSGAINLLRKSGLVGGRPEDLLKAFEDMVLAEGGRKIKVKGVPPARALKDIFQDAKGNVSELGDNLKKSSPAMGEIVNDPLTLEARKYKSAEEFVKAQRKMYRGTALPQKGDLDVADTYGLAYGKGAYLASDEAFARSYGNNISELYPVLKKPWVMDAEVPSDVIARIKKDFPDYNTKYGTSGEDIHSFFGNQNDANEYLQKLGYDGLLDAASTGSKQTIVFDPKNVLTKSQLTDIWERANKGKPPRLGKGNEGFVKPSTLAGLAGVSAAGIGTANQLMKSAPAPVQESSAQELPQAGGFDRTDFEDRIVGVENEALKASGGNLYGSVGVTGDLGKYQASPATLKDWSKPWLGKTMTPKEFLNNPEAQEKFWNEYLNVVDRLQLSPDEAAVAWHLGWGELGTSEPREVRDRNFREGLARRMQSANAQKYLAKFNR